MDAGLLHERPGERTFPRTRWSVLSREGVDLRCNPVSKRPRDAVTRLAPGLAWRSAARRSSRPLRRSAALAAWLRCCCILVSGFLRGAIQGVPGAAPAVNGARVRHVCGMSTCERQTGVLPELEKVPSPCTATRQTRTDPRLADSRCVVLATGEGVVRLHAARARSARWPATWCCQNWAPPRPARCALWSRAVCWAGRALPCRGRRRDGGRARRLCQRHKVGSSGRRRLCPVCLATRECACAALFLLLVPRITVVVQPTCTSVLGACGSAALATPGLSHAAGDRQLWSITNCRALVRCKSCETDSCLCAHAAVAGTTRHELPRRCRTSRPQR